ncbi:CFI-box-CTERM domain-containing protein [Paraflavitalea speifideaquila]|uniref:CFI-box-CTERM domain-containing protein n=1 Tax=Paraflavitalea speifideaquila TaxID=3076558 RepID=UPI0028EDB7C2|nr:CFI-box-CTERM domain-containing protein [Paraflavitalea speifideiaquila]
MLFIIDNFEEGRPCERAKFVKLVSNLASITGTSSRSCIIATVCFDTPDHPKVQLLKAIRDVDMAATRFGQHFVYYLNKGYYSFSPAVAGYLSRHTLPRNLARVLVIRPIILYMQAVKKITAGLSSASLKSLSLIIAFMLLLLGVTAAAAWLISWCYHLFIYQLNQ